MRVLVTGGAGFIGSHLVDELLLRGYDVTILDNLEPPTHRGGKPDYIPEKVRFIEGDMTNEQDLLSALEGVEGIFHLAATGGFTDEILKYVHSNSFGTALMMDVIRRKKIKIKKLVVASSVAVYGEGKYHCKGHGVCYPSARSLEQLSMRRWEVFCPFCQEMANFLPTDELSFPDPNGVYAITKYDQEKLVLCLGKQYGIRTNALRFFVTYGPRQSISNPYTGVCSIFSTLILNNISPIIYEDGNQARDFVYVKDLIKGIILVFESQSTEGDIFNIGSGNVVTILQLAKLLIEIYGKKVGPRVMGEFRLGDARNIMADITKIKNLGYQPCYDIESGLTEYVDWVRTQGKLEDYFSTAAVGLENGGIVRRAL